MCPAPLGEGRGTWPAWPGGGTPGGWRIRFGPLGEKAGTGR